MCVEPELKPRGFFIFKYRKDFEYRSINEEIVPYIKVYKV